jgi:leukotriene-A4 hydrolase
VRAAVLVVLAISCKGSAGAEHPSAPLPRDPHSYAEPERVAVDHLSLELAVDFTQRVLTGTAKLQLTRRDRDAPARLDTAGLTIDRVTECATQRSLAFALDTPHHVLGRQLVIQSPPDCVAIAYHTSPDSRALLWVDDAGTTGRNHPMLFTQSQAILARSWVPVQDTPSVRFTYDATIHVPRKLWAVMSAENPRSPPADGVWRFTMQQRIPSYLMALAVGDFTFRSLGPRSGVYAEPGVIDAAAKEFAEVEQMMAVAEKLYGPYRWGRYDMLVLPPSFPYGGMENPRLTFLTPTAITGDRSLVSLIAHELAHSWSGNLVTNATWADFWLNEGFTTYVERRIMEELRGREEADVLWHLGDHDFIKAMGKSPGPDTRLALDVAADRDPDDVPSDAAYEKGALFLRALEEAFGRAEFDAFLRRRFDRLAFSSTTTAAFEAEVTRELIARHPGKLSIAQLAEWLYQPGVPAGTLPRPSKRVDAITAIAGAYAASGTGFSSTDWSTLDWVIFLRALPPTLSLDAVKTLDANAKLTSSTNAEILMHWLPIAVRADHADAAPIVERYLLTVGRRRMIRPLYAAMVDKGGAWKTLAKTTFERARPLYHPIVRDTIAKLVGN